MTICSYDFAINKALNVKHSPPRAQLQKITYICTSKTKCKSLFLIAMKIASMHDSTIKMPLRKEKSRPFHRSENDPIHYGGLVTAIVPTK